jgi:hypothetical protein
MGSVSNQKTTPPAGLKPRGFPYPHAPCPNTPYTYTDRPTSEFTEQCDTALLIKIFGLLMRRKKWYLSNEFAALERVSDQNGDASAGVDKI